jgi:hypothetical protein
MTRIRKFWTLIGAVVVFLLVIIIMRQFWHAIENRYSFTSSSKTVIKELRALNRLETSSFTIEKVIDAGTTGGQLQQLFFGDRLLLIAHGEVVAGFDLTALTNENIETEHRTVRITLPAPQILYSRLDSDETRVYDRRSGLLTKGNKDLEAKARSEAEQQLRQAACQGNILNEASKNGRMQLTALFKSLGFETVVITIPQGKC